MVGYSLHFIPKLFVTDLHSQDPPPGWPGNEIRHATFLDYSQWSVEPYWHSSFPGGRHSRVQPPCCIWRSLLLSTEAPSTGKSWLWHTFKLKQRSNTTEIPLKWTLQANRSNTKISHYTHTCKQNLILIFLISCSPLCCTSHNHSELWWTHSCATDWSCSDDWYYSCWDIHSVRTALRHSNPAICLGVRKVRVIEFM